MAMMEDIALGGDEAADKTIDQATHLYADWTAQIKSPNTSLTVTNETNQTYFLRLWQNNEEPYGSTFTLNLGENANVKALDPRTTAEQFYNLGQNSHLYIQQESYEMDHYHIDMSGGDARFTYDMYWAPNFPDIDEQAIPRVTGFGVGDTLAVTNAMKTDYNYEDSSRTFYDSYGYVIARFHMDPPEYPIIFKPGEGAVSYACYLKGTHIATHDGESKVEELKAGDKVRTASGGINTVKWIGFRKLNRSQLPAEHALRASPIRICKSAFADNVPHRDLTVSPGHHFNFDGALVPALALLNGLTITQDFEIEQFEYYHVELEKFDMLLAEGAAAESFLEVGSNRNSFQNARTVTAHPDFGPAPKNVMLAEYVQKITPEIIEPIRRELFKRAEILTGARRTGDTDLRIEINGQIIRPQTACKKKGLYRFELPAGLSDGIRILSNAAVVRETSLIDRTDTRMIGVGISSMALVIDGQRSEIDLNDASLMGLHEAQQISDSLMRWTDGEAVIPARLLPSTSAPIVLELNVLRTHMYWTSGEQQKTRKAA